MKKLKRISLNDLSQAEMLKKEMNMLKGGAIIRKDPTTKFAVCLCSDGLCTCSYEGPKEGPDDDKWGGSSTSANREANGGTADVTVQVVGLGG